MDYIKELRSKIGHKTLLYPCATALIINDKNEVLLELRKDDGMYGYIGGMIEVDESVTEALVREIKEETNLDIISFELFNIYSGKEFHHIYPNKDEISPIDICFFIKEYKGNLIPQEIEVTKFIWCNKENLPSNLNFVTKKALEDYYKIKIR